MVDRLTRHFPLIGALALGLSLGACAQGGFTDEGSSSDLPAADEGNLAKSLLISMGAIDDPHPAAAPRFQARAPLVVPPKTTLPPPVDQDAALAGKRFPVDPEVKAEQERAARLKGMSGESDSNGNKALSLADQGKYRDLPNAGPVSGKFENERDTARPLSPAEMDGTAQAAALKAAESSNNTGPAARERSLLTPPADYRTPSDKAPLESPKEGLAAVKPSWWPF